MAKSRQTPVKMRKIPTQERSKVTIEAILDATAQLLTKGSVDSLTTNHIAQRAGISIGTLYQYFPNKMAVLTAMGERRRRATAKIVADRLAVMKADTVEDVARQIIRTLIHIVPKSHSDKQLTMLRMIEKFESPKGTLPIDGIAAIIESKIGAVANIPKSQTETSSFVLTRAVMGTIRHAAMEAPHLLDQQEFEDQLVRLVTGFLRVQ